MNPKLKNLETLVLEAAKQLKKLKDDNRKTSLELKNLQAENARLQAKLREHLALAERQRKVKARIEKLVGLIEHLEGAKGEPQDSAPPAPAKPRRQENREADDGPAQLELHGAMGAKGGLL